MIEIFIPYNTPSSKNSRMRTKSGLFIPSKSTLDWYKLTDWYFVQNKKLFLTLLTYLPPYHIVFRFVRKSKHKFDYINPAQTVQDAMVKHGWIEDDNADIIIPYFKKYSYDKNKAGVYISVINTNKNVKQT